MTQEQPVAAAVLDSILSTSSQHPNEWSEALTGETPFYNHPAPEVFSQVSGGEKSWLKP